MCLLSIFILGEGLQFNVFFLQVFGDRLAAANAIGYTLVHVLCMLRFGGISKCLKVMKVLGKLPLQGIVQAIV